MFFTTSWLSCHCCHRAAPNSPFCKTGFGLTLLHKCKLKIFGVILIVLFYTCIWMYLSSRKYTTIQCGVDSLFVLFLEYFCHCASVFLWLMARSVKLNLKLGLSSKALSPTQSCERWVLILTSHTTQLTSVSLHLSIQLCIVFISLLITKLVINILCTRYDMVGSH